MKQAYVSQMTLSNEGFVVLLKLKDDPRSVPMFTGIPEALGIALPLNHVKSPRPMTHDLLKHLLDVLECRMLRVEIRRSSEGVYKAAMLFRQPEAVFTMDCRPSDGIAMAVRHNAPILIEDDIADDCGVVVSPDDVVAENGPLRPAPGNIGEELGEPVEVPVSRVAALRQQLAEAVDHEAYEEAARLRDEIRKETPSVER